MGVAIYSRILAPNMLSQVHLTASKTKVAPVRTQWILRLELTASSILVKLVSKVQKEGKKFLITAEIKEATKSCVKISQKKSNYHPKENQLKVLQNCYVSYRSLVLRQSSGWAGDSVLRVWKW